MKLRVVLFLALAACSGTGASLPGVSSGSSVNPAVVAPKRFDVDLFVRGTDRRYNPDPIEAHGHFIFVAYQNATGPTGTGGNSTIVQYDSHGSFVRSVKVPGRCDGMRWNPYTNVMWITVNEDANSSMFTWDPTSNALTHYTFSSASHGGGYDDLAFSGGQAFIAASNPHLTFHGINKGPAVVSVVLSGTTAEVTPILYGNAKATDIPTGRTVTLNLTDPDSMTVAPDGDVLLVSQADGEIVYLHGAGSSSQAVSRLLVGTQLDDISYATKKAGLLYVVDKDKNLVYAIKGSFRLGNLYTEAPSDSGVHGFVGIVSQSNGSINPLITGFKSPTGLIFVPSRR